jgi:hypothetical protein
MGLSWFPYVNRGVGLLYNEFASPSNFLEGDAGNTVGGGLNMSLSVGVPSQVGIGRL